MLQSHSVEKLHRDEALVLMLADFVYRANIRMVQCGGSASFSAKTLQCLRVLRDILGEEFERHKPAERAVLGFVDHAHAPATEVLEDPVVGDGLTDEFGGGGQIGRAHV